MMRLLLFNFLVYLLASGSVNFAQGTIEYKGHGSCLGNYIPTFNTEGEFPYINNLNFKVVSKNLEGKSPGVIFLSGFSGFPFPIFTYGLICPPASGAFGVEGVGTVSYSLPIPYNTGLLGQKLYLQGLFVGNLKNTSSFSWAFTRGILISICRSIPKEVEAIYSKSKYQAFFRPVGKVIGTPTKNQIAKADVLGRAIWNSINVNGFRYQKTHWQSAGGVSCWIVMAIHQKTGTEFSLIPGGSFQMGDANHTGSSVERPAHWVCIEPFLLKRLEITQAEYRKIISGTPPWQGKKYVGPYSSCAANYITWNMAKEFCKKAGLRLPSESEWEYACRAWTTSDYYFGNSWKDLNKYAICNYWGTNQAYPHKGGYRLTNAFGLGDMLGNVWECCEDQYSPNHNCSPVDGSPRLSSGSAWRVNKGGSWYHRAGSGNFRSAFRLGRPPTYGPHDLGFRPAFSIR